MAGYDEIIYTIAAMVVFSMILMSANSMIHRNTELQVEGELEREVVSVAQNIIEESRTLSFDEITVDGIPPVTAPDGFTASSDFGTQRSDETGEDITNRQTFDDLDDFDGWSQTYTVNGVDYNVIVAVTYITGDTYTATSSKTNFKRISVQVTNEYLTRQSGESTEYEFSYIRNYYAD